MSQLKIQEFAQQHFGVTLTKHQLEMIAIIAADPEERIVITGAKYAGKTTAYKVALAYLQDGLKPVQEQKA